jgi:RHS repeat-associated protein
MGQALRAVMVCVALLTAVQQAGATCTPGRIGVCTTEGGCAGSRTCYSVDPENPTSGGEWGECAPTFALEPCAECGAGGYKQCTADGSLGPCQPASAGSELCGNGCDDDQDGQADEFCAESETFDYCAPNLDGTLTRWRCACSAASAVGYCLGSGDSQLSCNNPGGCLKAPAFGASGASQAGGNFPCCVSNLPCTASDLSGPNGGYVLSAFQCTGVVDDRFECKVGQSCADSNQCGDRCVGLPPTIHPTTGERSSEGAYCTPGPLCGEAQGGLSSGAAGGVHALTTSEEAVFGETIEVVGSLPPAGPPGYMLPRPPPPGGGTVPVPGSGGGGGGRDRQRPPETRAPTPEPEPAQCGSGSGVVGAAVSSLSMPRVALSDLSTRHQEADVGLRGSLGGFNFVRKYVSTDRTWAYHSLVGNGWQPFLPKPFGSSPSNVNSLRWWHGLYSFVQPKGWIPGVSTWAVRDTDGAVLEYEACSSGAMACFAKPRSTTLWSTARLYWSGSSFVLFKEGEGRLLYQSEWRSPPSPSGVIRRFFLSRVEEEGDTASGFPRVRLSLEYAVPPISGCPGLSTLGNGVPYLARVTTEDGAKLRVSYRLIRSAHAALGQECVLDQLLLRRNPNSADPAQSQEEFVVAKYQYPALNGIPVAGLLAGVEYPETGDVLTYSDTTAQASTTTSWALSVNGGQLVSHTYVDAKVSTAATASGPALSFSTTSGSCGPSPSGAEASQACSSPTVTPATGRAGDSGGTSVTMRREFSLSTPLYTPHSLVDGYTDRCLSGNCASFPRGSIWLDWMKPEGGTLQLQRSTDKRGTSSLFEYILAEGVTASEGLPKPVKIETWRLAADFWGNGAAYSGRTEHTYGQPPASSLPRPVRPIVQTTDSEDSVLQEGQKVFTRTTYDEATGRLRSVIRSGYTETFEVASETWSGPVPRHVGTFYFNHHKCSGQPDTGRSEVLEVHGPCAVSGPEATDCDLGNDFPITQYDYYAGPSIERSNRANKLKRISRFIRHGGPTACSDHPSLETTYDDYDARGNITSITDPRGVQTTFRLQGGRVSEASAAGLSMRFIYDGAHLTALRLPAGNHTVRCYRSGTPTGQGCTGGQKTDRLQWLAMAADAAGADWSEKRVFTYWPDGAVKTEEYRSRRDGVEETRRKVEYHPDAHRRPTYTRWGVGPGSFASVGAFDRNGNQTGIGLPFNEAPDFCAIDSTGQPLSQLCTTLGYDRADRLTQVREFPAPSVEQHTALSHDRHGNVASIQSGCASPAGCEQPRSSYRYDDFGNLLQVHLPHATGPVRYAYDARGNLTVKQTEAMRLAGEWVEYGYDALSRPGGATRVSPGNQSPGEQLFRLGFDDEGTVPAGCERYAGDIVDLKSWGLLRFREDSFGRTWFRYDTAGRLIGELRVRQGETACRTELETRYSHDSYGRLSEVRYPHERSISYVYRGGASAHRIAAIDVSLFTAAGTIELHRMVSDVVWEPYGGLRGYQLLPPHGGPIAVEYALGDDGSVAPGDCGAGFPAVATSDLTGRLRALWVSHGRFTPGVGSGDIYKRAYTWKADQVARIDTCLLGAMTPRTETYSYDRTLRLTGAGRPPGNFAATGGAFSSRVYGYDRRGNRVDLSEDDGGWTLVLGTGSRLDQIVSQTSRTDTVLSWTYTYDADGRVTRKNSGSYSSGGAAYALEFRYGPSPGGGGSGSVRETVFRTVQVNGANYSYSYDALGRRHAKVYPSGVRDEFFHSAGNALLVDQGSDSMLSTSFRTVDDYVWLGGRPVVLLRGKLEPLVNIRLPDLTTDCRRNGEAAVCGAYFPVTDHVGKPVLMLDSAGRVAGVADSDPLGHVNRVIHHASTAHPYPAGQSSLLAIFTQPKENNSVRIRLRALFHLVDTKPGADRIELVDSATGATIASASGPRQGRVVTPWVEPLAGSVAVRFIAEPTTEGLNGRTGAVIEGYEYQRFQEGAQPFWTPLRFPGQYYDAETDLFENWNRYYDPFIGRYLQPEPMLQHPQAVLAAALQGHSLPAYAYALNNPITFTDLTGSMPDSIKIKMLAMIARGDIAGAIAYHQLHTGRATIPKALQAMQSAFAAANRVAGQCQQVAKDIYSGFHYLGTKPEYLRITSTEGDFLSWQGRTMVSNNNFHVAVRQGGRIYDAFTGPAGMTEAEYIATMMHEGRLLFTVILSP